MAQPMVWLPPERKGFRIFVEKHDALFTTIGALIVFAGFYMKEGFREKAKDLAASLSRGKERYALNEQLMYLQTGLEDAKNHLYLLEYRPAVSERDIDEQRMKDTTSTLINLESSDASFSKIATK
jgi:hypothetical protein